MSQVPAVPAPFQSASLYVGDLHPETTESTLFDLFNCVGPVANVRVCRDSITRRSLGYAYVNFHNVQDAERALDTMNFSDIMNRPCRIMWSQRDPSLRKTGHGNIFVRNLAPSVDNKGLYDIFSVFGNILSCKVAQDEKGESKKYGYVHFETAEAAQDAISKLDGMLIDDVKVSVAKFVKRQDRNTAHHWTNLYLKQFPLSWTEANLAELCAPFGKVQSVFLSKSPEGVSKGFGFVNFEEQDAAEKALAELNGKTVSEEQTLPLYANRAQKKSERVREIRTRMETQKMDFITKSQSMNLYVKNLADSVTDEQFKDAFKVHGTITSARIMRDKDTQVSRGFGFVCYSAAEEAMKALAEMNGKLLNGKPLYVAPYQRQEQRKQQLAANFAPRFPAPAGMMPFPMYQAYGGQFPPRSQFPFPGGAAPRGMPRGMPGVPPMNYQRGGFMGQQHFMGASKGYAPRGAPAGMPRGMPPTRPVYPNMGAPYGAGPQGARNNIKFTPQARNQVPGAPVPQPVAATVAAPLAAPAAAPVAAPAQKLDFSQALLAADPSVQKNMIGEKLYPLIFASQPELAGKITGMLLEMDNAELINLIESPDVLSSKIDEALTVLRAHTAE